MKERKSLPIKPTVRPRTNNPFKAPISIYSCASSEVKQPLHRKRSTTAAPISPSTFSIRFGFCKVISGFSKLTKHIKYFIKLMVVYLIEF